MNTKTLQGVTNGKKALRHVLACFQSDQKLSLNYSVCLQLTLYAFAFTYFFPGNYFAIAPAEEVVSKPAVTHKHMHAWMY